MTETAKKFLIVKLSGIGDVIMALTMINAIRERYENAEITWVTGEISLSLLEKNKIDNIIIVNEKKILKGSEFDKISEVLKVWKKIAFKSYDEIIIPYRDKRYSILTLLTFYGKKFAFYNFKKRMFPIPGRNFYDEYKRIITGNDTYENKCNFLKSSSIYVLRKGNYIVLAPGGVNDKNDKLWLRRWPVEKYAELAKLLLKKDFEVIITGGKEDEIVLPYFKDLTVKNMIGKTNILESIELYGNAVCVVTHDSGVLHMAGYGNANIVALFGPTEGSVFMPKVKNGIYISKKEELPCCPCYDGKTFAECRRNECMCRIMPQEVYETILKGYVTTNS